MPEDLQKKIQDYLDGSLPQEELKSFKERLKVDPILAKEVQEIKEVDIALESMGADMLTAEMESWEKELTDSHQSEKQFSLRKILSLAATVAIVIVASVFLFRSNSVSPSELYNQNFTAYPNLLSSRDASAEDGLLAALTNYDQGDYAEAVEYFKKLPDSAKEPVVSLYHAISLLAIGDSENARILLSEIQQHPLYNQQAQWFMFLSFLKEEDQTGWERIGNEIIENPDHYQFEQTTRILKSLESN